MSHNPGSHTADAQPACWLLIEPAAMPSRLEHRARTMAVVPLLPAEARRMLDDSSPWTVLDPDDEVLAAALVAGDPTRAIARQLGVASRTVNRRIARLRDQLDVDSTEELVARLSRLGF